MKVARAVRTGCSLIARYIDAFGLAAVSAGCSITGLTSILIGATVPVIYMGVALELVERRSIMTRTSRPRTGGSRAQWIRRPTAQVRSDLLSQRTAEAKELTALQVERAAVEGQRKVTEDDPGRCAIWRKL
jgi:hypothetical protein